MHINPALNICYIGMNQHYSWYQNRCIAGIPGQCFDTKLSELQKDPGAFLIPYSRHGDIGDLLYLQYTKTKAMLILCCNLDEGSKYKLISELDLRECTMELMIREFIITTRPAYTHDVANKEIKELKKRLETLLNKKSPVNIFTGL